MGLLVVACGGRSPTSPDSGSAVPAQPFAPAAHAPFPEVGSTSTASGSVLTRPTVVPIVWQNDPLAGQLVDFAARLGSSSYWRQALGPYGVAPLSVGTADVETKALPPSLRDGDLRTAMADIFSGAGTVENPPSPGTVYAFFLPPGVGIRASINGADTVTGQSCVAFLGYHDAFQLGGGPYAGSTVVYAVIPRCPLTGELAVFTDPLDAVTVAASHEIVEATTDPTKTGWSSLADLSNFAWTILLGGEVGDLCAWNFFTPSDIGHAVQRIWSVEGALAGEDPCAPEGLYFGAAPTGLGEISVAVGGTTFEARGLALPVGASATVGLDLFSSAPAGPWAVSAVEPAVKMLGAPPTLAFAFDRTVGENGDVLHLTVTVLGSGTLGGALPGYEGFVVESALGTQRTFWPVLIDSR